MSIDLRRESTNPEVQQLEFHASYRVENEETDYDLTSDDNSEEENQEEEE